MNVTIFYSCTSTSPMLVSHDKSSALIPKIYDFARSPFITTTASLTLTSNSFNYKKILTNLF